MSIQKRKYELRARAERQAETRRRIAAATAALHDEVGPARTTVTEIARRAGVQRLTVYNHFPDEGELFAACQARFFATQPPPELEGALALREPGERLRAVLGAMYRWYRKTEHGFTPVLLDRGTVPALDQLLERTVDAQQSELAASLAAGFGVRGSRGKRLRALIRLALEFWTWRRLKEEGLDDPEAAGVMTELIASLAAPATAVQERP